jgi:hypothetical protein
MGPGTAREKKEINKVSLQSRNHRNPIALRSGCVGLVEGADMRYVCQIEFRPNDLAWPRVTRRTDDLLPKSRFM